MTALTPIEVATGIVFGVASRPLPAPAHRTPGAALEAAVRPALERGPCFVSFSGGRDSSAVLAAAAVVARREGLPQPVPVTIRAGEAPEADESAWQESVVTHLGLRDWVRIEIEDELDALGPYARQALTRHGLLWPFNAHFHSPMLEHASGGTLLTGIGGDELWLSSSARRISRKRRLAQLAPAPVRRAALARRVPIDFPWLRPQGLRAARLAGAADELSLPTSTAARMAEARGMRYNAVGLDALDLLADDAGAEIAHPLVDLSLWSAVATAATSTGFADGNAALRVTAGHLLPQDLTGRRTKACFDAVFFHKHARGFAYEWTGGGVPVELVDEAALREHWLLGAEADPHALTLMQAAWLASAGDRVDQARSRVAQ